jgi:PAS domain S-box-containing protein
VSLSLTFDAPVSPPLLESLLELDQAVLDALPIGIYACDADGRIVRVNREAIRLWGRAPRLQDPAQRFCGSFRLESLAGEPIPPEQTPMARAVLDGESFQGAEALVENPDGKRWVARVNVAPMRDVGGAVVGAINCFQDVSREYEMRRTLERHKRTFDLAMIASQMGTWRYTLADNVCEYDDNAQRLYGLTEARFLHDEAGVREKFHPDDLERMWARVARAVDPAGDGRYEVEYRVRQPDGSWRWLSAWGLVEFEGQGEARQAVAIAGASRDLTERNRADEMRRLLVKELQHRVKNSLAIVQSIAFHTLRDATEIGAARSALDARILSLARTHDVIIERNWVAADLAEVVARVLAPFAAAQIDRNGPSLDIQPQLALTVTLALHELATNAAKHGALSRPEGRVELRWEIHDEQLVLTWREVGGPPVAAPCRRGFGSTLLEQNIAGGKGKLEFAPEGARYSLSTSLADRRLPDRFRSVDSAR